MNKLLDLQGKKIVVTGAGGYIGSALINELVKHSCDLIAISRHNLISCDHVHSMRGDLCDPQFWGSIVYEADIIFHLAGNTSLAEASSNPVGSINSTITPIGLLVQAASMQRKKPRVVFTSTATVYGLLNELPVTEDAEPKPVTNYDLHKLFAEEYLKFASNQGFIEGISLRLSNVYGPSLSPSTSIDRGIINKVSANSIRGEKLLIFGDGNYLRDYVHINDVVDALILAGITPGLVGESFNIASGVGLTVKNAFELIANKAEKLTGRVVKIEFDNWPIGSDPIEKRNFVADINKYTVKTGWIPKVKFDEGIDSLLDNFLSSNHEKNMPKKT